MKSKAKPTRPVEIVTDETQHVPRCPQCREPIAVQATVERFNEPYKWEFWGRPSERWIKCQGNQGGHNYVHFVTLVNGAASHRLAWVVAPRKTPYEQMELMQ